MNLDESLLNIKYIPDFHYSCAQSCIRHTLIWCCENKSKPRRWQIYYIYIYVMTKHPNVKSRFDIGKGQLWLVSIKSPLSSQLKAKNAVKKRNGAPGAGMKKSLHSALLPLRGASGYNAIDGYESSAFLLPTNVKISSPSPKSRFQSVG